MKTSFRGYRTNAKTNVVHYFDGKGFGASACGACRIEDCRKIVKDGLDRLCWQCQDRYGAKCPPGVKDTRGFS